MSKCYFVLLVCFEKKKASGFIDWVYGLVVFILLKYSLHKIRCKTKQVNILVNFGYQVYPGIKHPKWDKEHFHYNRNFPSAPLQLFSFPTPGDNHFLNFLNHRFILPLFSIKFLRFINAMCISNLFFLLLNNISSY